MAASVHWQMMWHGLPVELLDMILENAVWETQKSCSLICRSWLDAACRHIFDHIAVHTQSTDDILRPLGAHIRISVTLSVSYDGCRKDQLGRTIVVGDSICSRVSFTS